MVGRHRQPVNANGIAWDIDERSIALDEVVIVIGRVGVKIGPLAADGDFTQEPRPLELVQRVVDGCQRNALTGAHRLLVQDFGGHVPVAVGEQKLRQRDPLARWPQAGTAKQFAGIDAC